MTEQHWRRWLPHLAFIAVYLLWGINIPSMKIGGREWDPFIFNGLRYIGVLPLLWGFTFWQIRAGRLKLSAFRLQRQHLLLLAALGVLSGVFLEAVYAYALQYSTTANGAVLGRGFMPIITCVIALSMKQIRLSWRVAFGLPLAFISVIVIVWDSGLNLGGETMKGDVLLLLRSLAGAFYLIGMNRIVGKYPLTVLLTLEMTVSAIALSPFVIKQVDYAYLANMSMEGWLSLVYTTVFATVLGFSLHNWSLGKLGAFRSSAYGYLLPVTAALAGYVLLHEKITAAQYAGAVGVFTAMYFVQKDRLKGAAVAPPRVAAAKEVASG